MLLKKKKKIRIWAWIKLMINTFNVTLRMCWEQGLPPRSRHAAGTAGLHNFPWSSSCSRAPFALSRGENVAPGCGGLLPQQWAPPAATLGQCFLPMKPLWLPKLLAGDSRVPQSASTYFRSHPGKRSSSASNLPFKERERSIETRGSWWFCSKATPWAHLQWSESKGLGTRCSYFRGRWGNSSSWCPACQDLENQMLMALRLPIYTVPVPSYSSQVFLTHFLGWDLMMSAEEHPSLRYSV